MAGTHPTVSSNLSSNAFMNAMNKTEQSEPRGFRRQAIRRSTSHNFNLNTSAQHDMNSAMFAPSGEMRFNLKLSQPLMQQGSGNFAPTHNHNEQSSFWKSPRSRMGSQTSLGSRQLVASYSHDVGCGENNYDHSPTRAPMGSQTSLGSRQLVTSLGQVGNGIDQSPTRAPVGSHSSLEFKSPRYIPAHQNMAYHEAIHGSTQSTNGDAVGTQVQRSFSGIQQEDEWSDDRQEALPVKHGFVHHNRPTNHTFGRVSKENHGDMEDRYRGRLETMENKGLPGKGGLTKINFNEMQAANMGITLPPKAKKVVVQPKKVRKFSFKKVATQVLMYLRLQSAMSIGSFISDHQRVLNWEMIRQIRVRQEDPQVELEVPQSKAKLGFRQAAKMIRQYISMTKAMRKSKKRVGRRMGGGPVTINWKKLRSIQEVQALGRRKNKYDEMIAMLQRTPSTVSPQPVTNVSSSVVAGTDGNVQVVHSSTRNGNFTPQGAPNIAPAEVVPPGRHGFVRSLFRGSQIAVGISNQMTSLKQVESTVPRPVGQNRSFGFTTVPMLKKAGQRMSSLGYSQGPQQVGYGQYTVLGQQTAQEERVLAPRVPGPTKTKLAAAMAFKMNQTKPVQMMSEEDRLRGSVQDDSTEKSNPIQGGSTVVADTEQDSHVNTAEVSMQSNESSEEDFMFIDGTQGPWEHGRMKKAVNNTVIMNRMQTKPPSGKKVKKTRQHEDGGPGHVEVELQDGLDSMKKKKRHKPRKRRPRSESHATVQVDDVGDIGVEDSPERGVSEGQTEVRAAAFINGPQQGDLDHGDILPAPVISVEHTGDGELVRWRLLSEPDKDYNLLVFVVNVVGQRFDQSVNSDLSFECLQSDISGPALQHCWNITDNNECLVKGLSPGATYRIYVVATYSLDTGQVSSELQFSSAIMYYTTLGKPDPPNVWAKSADLYQVSLEWEPGKCHEDIHIVGYDVMLDGQKAGETLGAIVRQTNIDNLKPGKTVNVTLMTITKHPVGNSDQSLPIKITCPKRPLPPIIHVQPSYKKGCVMIGWQKVTLRKIPPPNEDVLFYCVYMDGVWHAEIRANQLSDKEGYQYCLTDLEAGQSYDINVRSFAGRQKCESTSRHHYCLCDSELSNTLPVMCAAPPLSPSIKIEGMSMEGIDITWETPQQLGEAVLSGFQLFRNGKLYGSVIPSEVNTLRIMDVSLGDKVSLQMIALTEHPVGRHGDKVIGNDGDSGIGHNDDIPLTEKYSACKPGPKLVFHYTGLVQPPTKVWCEQVTGHSAMVVWTSGEKPRSHYIIPDSYQVTWWPGQQPLDDIISQTVTDDHLLISGLTTSTVYTVVVEARKLQKYSTIQEDENFVEEDSQTFILTAKSDLLTLKTAQPPDAPCNLGVIATTCHGLMVAWDPPREHGVEVVAVRVDAVSKIDSEKVENSYVEVLPDKTSAILENLKEATEYEIIVTAITEEFFDNVSEENSRLFKNRVLPRNGRLIPRDCDWLPYCSMIAMTSGTVPPSELQIVEARSTSLVVSWKPAVVYGSNRLQGGVIRWTEISHSDSQQGEFVEVASHKELLANECRTELTGLTPGAQYKLMLEAIVSIRTVINVSSIEEDEKNRRTAHIMSQPILARTRAPVEAPRVYIAGFTSTSVNLFWEKPLLYSVVGLDEDDQPRYIKRCLEGYRLEINGKPHMMVGAGAQSCTLTKCRPGRTYSVVLVALTCTEAVKRERKRKMRGTVSSTSSNSSHKSGESQTTPMEDDDNDESPSSPLELMLPRIQHGNLECVSAKYNHDVRGACDFGDIDVEWTVQENASNVKQFSAIWVCLEDGIVHRKCLEVDTRRCTIPVTKNRCIYEVTVEPQFTNGDSLAVHTQCVQVMVPGSPDSPHLFTRSVTCDEFVVEWGEPRLYGGVKVKGYQMYMNDRKVGNMLSCNHRKAVVPARPNRHYKMTLVALSASTHFADSAQSAALLISTPPRKEALLAETSLNMNFEDFVDLDGDKEIPLRVVKASDTSIQLDWSTYFLPEAVAYYKVQWSSVAQPAQKELRLSRDETGCVLQKLYPGTNHFVKVVSMESSGHILERSCQCTVQTAAPPDTPIVGVRAVNFKYIAIQWEKPKCYGEALITGYKVYINGIVETTVSADQFTYSFTTGKSCQEYSFQVQALTTIERLYGKPSEPLLVTWPGIRAPSIQRVPTISASSIKVTWDLPYCTEGVKVKQYKLYCKDPTGDRTIQCISPIHPDSQEAELHNLKSGSYMVYLEIHLHGTPEVTRTEPLFVEPSLMPEPPIITVTVIGLEERRQLEKVTCELLNKRDRLLKTIQEHSGLAWGVSPKILHRSDVAELSIRASESLVKVDEMLDDCFASLSHYTGHLLAHVSWQNQQTDPAVNISSFKILIDGKQYGTSVHSGVRNVRIKLSLDQPSHVISMVAVADQPRVHSASSSEVELLTQPFFPFTFYCLHNIHTKDTGWPNTGCCRYEDSIIVERSHSLRQPVSQGLLKRHIPPPSCKLPDVFDGIYKQLLPPSGPQRPTVLVFWTRWCLASLKLMSWYSSFAKLHQTQYDFIAIACDTNMTDSRDRQELIHTISENGWMDDTSLRHCTSTLATPVDEATQNVRHNMLGKPPPQVDTGGDSNDITDILGVYGVPTIIIIHPKDYIAWHGRYSAHDYTSFQAFLLHTLTKVMELPCPTTGCDVCRQEQMDEDNLTKWKSHKLLQGGATNVKSGYAASTSLIIPNINFLSQSVQADSESSPGSRPTSAGRLFMKPAAKSKDDNRINVNARPFSATERSSSGSNHDSPQHEPITRPRSDKKGRRKIVHT